MTQLKPDNPRAKALEYIITTLETFSSIMILIMMLLTFVDVIGRYLLGAPVFGASEMVSALLALVVFSGLGIANARDSHIVVELFDTRIRRIAPRFYDVIVQGFSILAMCLIAFVLFEIALESYQQEARTFVLEWPLFYVTGAISFLAFVSVVSQVLGLIVKNSNTETLQVELDQ